MPNLNLTNTARLKGRELLRRPRFPAMFPADRGALKPWTVGEGYLYRFDHRKPGLSIAISGSHQVTISWSRLKLNGNGPTLERFALVCLAYYGIG